MSGNSNINFVSLYQPHVDKERLIIVRLYKKALLHVLSEFQETLTTDVVMPLADHYIAEVPIQEWKRQKAVKEFLHSFKGNDAVCRLVKYLPSEETDQKKFLDALKSLARNNTSERESQRIANLNYLSLALLSNEFVEPTLLRPAISHFRRYPPEEFDIDIFERLYKNYLEKFASPNPIPRRDTKKAACIEKARELGIQKLISGILASGISRPQSAQSAILNACAILVGLRTIENLKETSLQQYRIVIKGALTAPKHSTTLRVSFINAVKKRKFLHGVLGLLSRDEILDFFDIKQEAPKPRKGKVSRRRPS